MYKFKKKKRLIFIILLNASCRLIIDQFEHIFLFIAMKYIYFLKYLFKV